MLTVGCAVTEVIIIYMTRHLLIIFFLLSFVGLAYFSYNINIINNNNNMCNSIGNISRLCIIGGCCLGLAMQFFVTFQCNFLTTPERNIGIWYVDDGTGNCVDWPAEASDPVLAGAQSTLTISTIAGFFAGALVLFEWLICGVCCAGCFEGLAFCGAWLFGGCVFMIYGVPECGDYVASAETIDLQGDSGCEWGSDSTLMTVACFSYLACGVVFCCTPKPDPICKQ